MWSMQSWDESKKCVLGTPNPFEKGQKGPRTRTCNRHSTTKIQKNSTQYSRVVLKKGQVSGFEGTLHLYLSQP